MKKIKHETVPVKTNWVDWGVYTVMFFIILLPFIEIGFLKLISVSLVLGLFAAFLNRHLREWYIFKKFFTDFEEE